MQPLGVHDCVLLPAAHAGGPPKPKPPAPPARSPSSTGRECVLSVAVSRKLLGERRGAVCPGPAGRFRAGLALLERAGRSRGAWRPWRASDCRAAIAVLLPARSHGRRWGVRGAERQPAEQQEAPHVRQLLPSGEQQMPGGQWARMSSWGPGRGWCGPAARRSLASPRLTAQLRRHRTHTQHASPRCGASTGRASLPVTGALQGRHHAAGERRRQQRALRGARHAAGRGPVHDGLHRRAALPRQRHQAARLVRRGVRRLPHGAARHVRQRRRRRRGRHGPHAGGRHGLGRRQPPEPGQVPVGLPGAAAADAVPGHVPGAGHGGQPVKGGVQVGRHVRRLCPGGE